MGGRRVPRGGLFVPSAFAAAALAVLIGLGAWQVERLQWKRGLIAALAERLSAPPRPLPPPPSWASLDRAALEFRHVVFSAEFLHDKEALVFTAGSNLRPDVSGPGYWVFTPARLPGGSLVMVDRGFVPETAKDPARRAAGQITGLVDIIGVLRWPEERGRFTPADDPGRNLWFVRDPQAVAEAKGLGRVAPFYVAQESPLPPGDLPRAGKLAPNLPNRHLEYALTWFGLALVLAAVFAAWLLGRRRSPGTTRPP
ncbi:MAG TPA: SURF1 family protein [Xanthobacteraceae bacterium]|nr:SURF1 family protein [Xanthobacteraceae bacterium]